MARTTFHPARPYNELPRLPPRADLESKAVLKSCIRAHAALAELKGAGGHIPNAAILINTIPVLEARASSEIENSVTTADRLFRFAAEGHGDAQTDPATKEALRYRTALRKGVDSLSRKPLGTGTAVEVCRAIRGVDLDVRRVPGTALTHQTTGTVVYTPPGGESHLRDLLGNWERYLHAIGDVDPLVVMAVGHYQFEAIHPFTDGNGRTGRILNLLFLVERGLLNLPVLYLSRGILATKADYYRRLLRVTTHGEWEAWTTYMVRQVDETARWTTNKLRAIRSLMDRTTERVQARLPKLYSRELIEVLFTQPYCRIANIVAAGLAQRQAAATYLKDLAAIGVLREQKVGREKLFLNPRLIALLTSETHDVPGFASKTGRRSPGPPSTGARRRA